MIMHLAWLLTQLDAPLFEIDEKIHKTYYVPNLCCWIKDTAGSRAPSGSATAAGDFTVCHTLLTGHSTNGTH